VELNCLKQGFSFDNIVFQLNWRNPEVWDRMGKFMAVFDDSLEFTKLSEEEGLKLLFEFKRYSKIVGSIQRSRLWFQMKTIDSNYTLALFRDQTFKVITKTLAEIPPLNLKSFGIRIATILSTEEKKHFEERFLGFAPFHFENKVGNLHNLYLQWVYKNDDYEKYFKFSQYIRIFQGRKTPAINREDLPDKGIVLDIDSIVTFKENNDNTQILKSSFKNHIIPEIIKKYDEIALELLSKLG